MPEWINFNQAVSLLVFLGVVISGLHLEYVKVGIIALHFILYK